MKVGMPWAPYSQSEREWSQSSFLKEVLKAGGPLRR